MKKIFEKEKVRYQIKMNLNVNIYLLPRLPELHYETINLHPGN